MGEARVRNYTGALAAFAIALVVAWSYKYGLKVESQPVVGTVVFACFILLGALFSIRVSERTTIGGLLDTESEGYRMADDHRIVFPSLDGGARPGASDPRRDENLGRALPR